MSYYPQIIQNDDLAVEIAKPKLKKPPLYRVLMINDDYTTMDFVIEVLKSVFYHRQEKAAEIMLHVHQRGVGICGIYTREVAETKVEQVIQYAKQQQHPLQCTMEPDAEGSEDGGEV